MRKPPSQRLQTVLQLARLREQVAAGKLADNIRNVESNNDQKQQLQHYKSEYRSQFQQLGEAGKSGGSLANFLRFFGNLEGASEAQQQRTVLAVSQLEQARAEWQRLHSRQKNMETLIERKQRQEERALENKIQRQLDDRSILPDKR